MVIEENRVRLAGLPRRSAAALHITSRACLKIAFCKIPSQFASDFMLDLGGVVGYIDEIQHRIRCKVGQKIVGMNFQTRSSPLLPP